MTGELPINRPFQVFVLNPAGCSDPAIAIAACRAGAIGVFNAELPIGAEDLADGLDRLRRFAHGSFGMKLAGADAATLDFVASQQPFGLRHIVLDEASARAHHETLKAFRAQGGQVMVEVTGWTPGLETLGDSVDGWWAKGHEAGGWVGEQCSFILLRNMLAHTTRPVIARGGVNLHSVAGCKVGGAEGVVLDDQMLLLRESPLANRIGSRLQRFTGQETILIDGKESGRHLRYWSAPGVKTARRLQQQIENDGGISEEHLRQVGWGDGRADALIPPLGQDAAFAVPWAQRYGSVAQVLRAIDEVLATRVEQALGADVVGENTPLARAHGTRFPLVQGPMTHVSDKPEFIQAVAAQGGLPMVAMALTRGENARSLLRQTRELLGDRAWGVGLLGFVPPDVLQEQQAAIGEARPPFAIIAGGRPDQAEPLERAGIPTYLHVPSPVLLEQFLEKGSRRFIFEGRECGGHIGPLSSFVLWGKMIDALVDHPMSRDEAQRLYVLLAGGISDARSAAMAAAIAAPLAAKGVRVGFLMGTAYIFTAEAVSAKAIMPDFQRVAIECVRTVGLATGPGHVSRCALTPFAETFWQTRRELEAAGVAPNEVRAKLEDLSLGRLRLASKGLVRLRDGNSELSAVAASEQLAGGMYMIGDVATLIDRPTTIANLHRSVTLDAHKLLQAQRDTAGPSLGRTNPAPADVAIVGVATLLPGAHTPREYWTNILDRGNFIREVPPDRWDWRLYFDADRRAPDKVYSRWGGFIEPVPFDPTRYGIPPNTLPSIDPMQLLALEVVRRGLEDAGYGGRRPQDPENTSVILGISGGLGELGLLYGTRAELTRLGVGTDREVLAHLPEWTSDSFAGLLPNVAAGRVANRFDFGGINCTVDAACASSLAAIYQAVLELTSGRSDMIVAGGVDTLQSPFSFMCFSTSQALSPSGRCRTFDADADGIAISEGSAVVVLKRLADAERDGDRIYAVIKGVGASSDGRAKGMTAPLPRGQQRALRRAYGQAGFSAASVGLIEAHGTGTVAGDKAELETVIGVLQEAGAEPASCAIGSVKTMIGHTKASAGLAGLIKATFALHHRVLPPHAGVERPNPVLAGASCPVFLNQTPRPWVRSARHLRRAGVSSFGFGGTNFHVAVEEYAGEYRTWTKPALRDAWPVEFFAWRGENVAALATALQRTLQALDNGAKPPLNALSMALVHALPSEGLTLAIVADSLAGLQDQIRGAVAHLGSERKPLPAGVYFAAESLGRDGKLAFMFPGQGSQYPDMLRELAITFPEVGGALDDADAVLEGTPTFAPAKGSRLGRLIYPGDRFTAEQEQAARAALTRTEVAQAALGAVESGLVSLLRSLAVNADMVGGHSYGEYVALHAAGALSREALLLISEARGRFIAEAAATEDLGTMAAVAASAEQIGSVLEEADEVVCANFNSPVQTVISGSCAGIQRVVERLTAAGMTARNIPVAAAFHSRLMQPARDPLARFIDQCSLRAPLLPVYANTTAARHSADPVEVRSQLADHLMRPVNFRGMVEAMYADGARVFLEVGPKSVLSDLIRSTIGDRPHVAVSVDGRGGGLVGLLHALATLTAHGCKMDLRRLFTGRTCRQLDLDALPVGPGDSPPSPNTWWVDGGHARKSGGTGSISRHRAGEAPTTAEAMHQAPVLAGPDVRREEQPAPSLTPELPLAALSEPPQEAIPMNPDATPATIAHVGDQMLAEYHQTMRYFLRVQEQVMLACLGASADSDVSLQSGASFAPLRDWAVAAPAKVPAINGVLVAGGTPSQSAGTVAPVTRGNGAAHPPGNGAAPVKGAAPPGAAPPPIPVPEMVPPSVTAAPPPSAPAAGADFKALLLDLVSDKTGYPMDMLDINLAIEADLGIDSIKRVEILGAFHKALPGALAEKLKGGTDMQVLSTAPTLKAILDFVSGRANEGGSTNPFEFTGGAKEGVCAVLPRYVVRAQTEEAGEVALEALPAGLYLITSDDAGVSAALAERLEGEGVRAVELPDDILADENKLGFWISEQAGPVRAVIHLAPIRRATLDDSVTLAQWRERMDRDVKALFTLLRLAGSDLMNGGRVITASAMGGEFGRDIRTRPDVGRVFPGGAGNVGLVKALSLEWMQCRCKAVDLDFEEAPEHLAEHIFRELALPGGRREVGYPGGKRTIFRTEPASLRPLSPPAREPDQSWVVLAIGGTRGITAEVLRELAARRATLVLVARGALHDEGPVTSGLRSAEELRAHFVEIAKREGVVVRPVEVQAKVNSVLRDREIAANIADFTDMGAKVDFRPADLRQESEVIDLLSAVYEAYGRIDAVLYGAGIIEDQLLIKKTAVSVGRVFDTKVDGLFLLAKHLRPQTLRFVAIFTSVAGRYGNPGQTDYAAANETLNRYAWQLQAKWGDRVKVSSINWGPWSHTTHGLGMVTPERRRQFELRGVVPVPPDEGRRFLLQEILYAPVSDVEVVAGLSPWEYDEARHGNLPRPAPASPIPADLPLLQTAAITQAHGDKRILRKTIDLVSDPYLDHHRIDGVPVMPFVGALEHMAESVKALGFPAEIVAMRDIKMLRGMVLTNGSLRVEVQTKAVAGTNDVEVQIGPVGATRPVYRGIVEHGASLSTPPRAVVRRLENLSPMSIGAIYNRWLFHGPVFQTIVELIGLDHSGVVARIRSTAPKDFYPPAAKARWIFDVGLMDAALQLVSIWSRAVRNTTALPGSLRRIQRFGDAPLPDELIVDIEILSSVEDPSIRCRFAILDEAGGIRILVEDLEGGTSRELNRLGGGWAGGTIGESSP
jgi:acyl transferase domain-containing protein/NAD(P)H-dependent flavin oxidoreductase YrpB (nitropropane dioxygenase family)/NAD(P)-dependent dehydrogenase (short-subunit alcohol dehydrogenase family)